MRKSVARIELMIQDESFGALEVDLVEARELAIPDDDQDRFLDGPACRRVAVVDFDPATGAPLPPPAPFKPTTLRVTRRGEYETTGLPRDDPRFLAVNAFGTVFETIEMFESRGALGRPVSWAFEGDQLLIVPRAGKWDNAFYERDSRSLQFFWFEAGEETVYTALSRDIVAHECGHALLDAVVPSLYDSLTPESLAIHEAVADLVAVLMALRSKELRTSVLAQTDGSISDATWFSGIAERFGSKRPTDDGRVATALRDLRNADTMETVDRRRPHRLSTILSATFYDTLIDVFDNLKAGNLERSGDDSPEGRLRAAGRALGTAEIVFRRLLLRAIDYLPPGDLTFADVARATLAADRAATPDGDDPAKAEARDRFAQRFVDRRVVDDVGELTTEVPSVLAVDPERLADLRDSDWVAYRYVEEHRELIGIPPDTGFWVWPRIDATKEIGRKLPGGSRYATQRELLVKVAWDELEDNGVEGLPVGKRRIPTGATIALRWEDGQPLALVRGDVRGQRSREARDGFLQLLLDEEQISVVTPEGGVLVHGADPDVKIRLTGDVARIMATQRLLHVSGD
jgi:hypothetical protein